jgi:hypothetical protein
MWNDSKRKKDKVAINRGILLLNSCVSEILEGLDMKKVRNINERLIKIIFNHNFHYSSISILPDLTHWTKIKRKKKRKRKIKRKIKKKRTRRKKENRQRRKGIEVRSGNGFLFYLRSYPLEVY